VNSGLQHIADAIASTGLAPTAIVGAVRVGGDDVAELARARDAVPGVPLLSLAATQRDPALAVMRWCLAHRLDPSRVAWWIEPDAVGSAAAAAVHDVLWSHCASLFDELRVRASVATKLGDVVRDWADLTFERGLLHAALPAYLLLERWRPAAMLASRIAIAWARLGCPARACEWLSRSDIPRATRLSAQADFEGAADESRREAEQQLARNLAHLSTCWPAVATAIAAARTDEIEVWWCADVPWRLRVEGERFAVERVEHPQLVRREGGVWRAVRTPERPLGLRNQLDPRTPLPALHACIGAVADHAGLVNVLRNRIVSNLPNWRQAVCAIETDAALLRKLAESVELAPLLRTDLIESLAVGPDEEDELVAAFAARPMRLLPRVRSGCSAALIERFAALESSRNLARDRTMVALARHYDGAFAERVLAKLQAGEPLRVWAWTSIHTTVLQHVARGLLDGFAALGHDVRVLVEADPRERIGAHDVVASLAEHLPDLAILVDHTRPEYGPLLPPGLPVAGWILDELPLLADPRVLARLGPNDFGFAWSLPLTRMYRELGYPHCETLPFAVDEATYFADPTIVTEPVVAYATHLSFPDELPWAPGLYAALERRMMEMDEVPSGVEPLRPLLDATVAELGLTIASERQAELAYQCLMIARHVDRVKVADRVLAAGLPIALYGRGWARIERFAAHHRGQLVPGPELRRMYQSHAVVLHINTRCNLHPRVLEAAACGGFVLARSDGDYDFAPGGVDGCLRVGTELCLFDDWDDMIAKIRRAFTDAPWRSRFARAGHDRVHAEHTYRARAATILAELQRAMGTRRAAA
jgi:Glycosyl transferases group 1